MSVLLGAVSISPSNTGVVSPMYSPTQPMEAMAVPELSSGAITLPSNFNPQGATIPQYDDVVAPSPIVDSKVPATPTANGGSSDYVDNSTSTPTTSSVMDKVKKYAPYVIGGLVLLYLVKRKK